MTAPPPPTPEEIALGNAQTNLTTAETNFTSAQTTANTTITGAISGLQTTLDGLQSTMDGNIDTAQGTRDTQVDGHRTTLNGALDGLKGTLNGALDTFKGTLDVAVDTANGIHQSAVDTAQGIFDGDVTTIETTLNTDLDAARGTFDGATGGFQATFDGNLVAPLSTFNSDMGAANSAFASTFTTQSGTYSTQEAAFWSSYLTAIGSGPTGLITTFNNDMANADAALTLALAPYPGVVYDPSIITSSPSFQSFQQSQWDTLQATLQTLMTNYNDDLQDEQDGFSVDLYGATGVWTAFSATITAEDADYDNDLETAQDDYNDDIDSYYDLYETAVNGPGGLQDVLDGQIATEEADFQGDMAAARTAYDSTMAGPKATFESTRDTLIQEYKDFINNTGSDTINETITITETSPPPSASYTITHTSTMGTTTTSWTETTSVRPAELPTGATTITITQSSTGGNPYEPALRERLESLEEELDGLDEDFGVTAAAAKDVLETAVRNANQSYWDNVYGPGSGFATYVSNTYAAMNTQGTTVQIAYNQYQTNMQSAMTSFMMAMMTAMMTGGPMPPMPNLDAFKKTFWEKEAVADAVATDATGALLVSFVTTERSFDTTRDTAIVNAIGVYLNDIENAENDRQVARDNAIADYNQDVLAIQQAFMADAAQRAVTMSTGIENAYNVYELAHNGAMETFRKAGNDAVEEYDQDVAGHIENFRNQEATEWRQYQVSAAGAYQTLMTDQTNALVERINDGAGAALTMEQGVNGALATREQNIAAIGATFRSNFTGAYLTYASTVANQLASDYSAYYGFAVPETNVALAYATHTISQVGAWATALNTEATSYQGYVNSESGQRQSVNDTLAAADRERITGTVGGPVGITAAYASYMSSVASEANTLISSSAGAAEIYEQSVAGHEHTAQFDYADKAHTFNDSVFTSRKTLEDSRSNAGLNYMTSGFGSIGTYAANAVAPSLTGTQAIAGENDTLAGAIETETHNYYSGRFSNETSTSASLLGTEDAMQVLKVQIMVAQRSVQQWQRAVDYQDAPASYFTSMTPSPSTPWMLTSIFLTVAAPPNPSAPPPPPSPPVSLPTPTPPKDEGFENPYWEGFKGALHGFFVTGPKAVVNSTVDTVGGFVSLGQWDPPDVIQVNPMTDLGYDSAAAVARVGTEAALAAATGGLSNVSRVGKVVNAIDTVGNVVNGVQGGINASQNGLNLQNGVQIATGLIGLGQAGKTAQSAMSSQAAMSTMEKFCFAPDTLVSTWRGQKRIGDIEPGERVHAFDFASGQWVLSTVQQRHDNPYSGDWVTLEIEGSKIEATANHPFWVIEGDSLKQRPAVKHLVTHADEGHSLPGRWVNSQDLQRGDSVLSVDGRTHRVETVTVQDVADAPVCNLTIERHHSFAVGEHGVLAHNIGFCDVLEDAGHSRPGALNGVAHVHGHHIVQKTIPKQYTTALAAELAVDPSWSRSQQAAWYIGKSHEIMAKFKVPILETKALATAAAVPGATRAGLHNLCYAINGKGTHSLETIRHVYQKLSTATDADDVYDSLDEIARIFESGRALPWL